jgi:hypothetical protein
MSIATAITAAQGRVANAYTAVSNKGGTLPQVQNLTNLPTAISSIPSGGGSGILETIMENVVAGNNPVDTTALATAEASIAAFLTI